MRKRTVPIRVREKTDQVNKGELIMTLIDGTGATQPPPSRTTDSSTEYACPVCPAAVVVEDGWVSVAHVVGCPADMNRLALTDGGTGS